MFDVSKHSLVPKHIKLKENEVDELLKKYNISIKQLPKILSNDPVVKILDAKKGDVIMIKRKSSATKESIFYRVVV